MLAATPFKAVSQFVLLNLIFPSLFPLFKKKKNWLASSYYGPVHLETTAERLRGTWTQCQARSPWASVPRAAAHLP